MERKCLHSGYLVTQTLLRHVGLYFHVRGGPLIFTRGGQLHAFPHLFFSKLACVTCACMIHDTLHLVLSLSLFFSCVKYEYLYFLSYAYHIYFVLMQNMHTFYIDCYVCNLIKYVLLTLCAHYSQPHKRNKFQSNMNLLKQRDNK